MGGLVLGGLLAERREGGRAAGRFHTSPAMRWEFVFDFAR